MKDKGTIGESGGRTVVFPLKNRIGQVYEPFKVRFLEQTIEGIGNHEILIRIRASAICGSDLHIARGRHPSAPLPVTIGHEFSGDVAAIGSEVRNFRIGDRVCVEPALYCGKCEACRRGDYAHCEHLNFTYRTGKGAMADYIAVDESCAYKLPEAMSYAAGALIEPMAVSVHAVRKAGVCLDETVLIIGPGAIGLMTAAICRLSGASKVIVAGRNRAHEEAAVMMGATHYIDAGSEDLIGAVRKITNGRGLDKSFECVGRESCLKDAIAALKPGGCCTVVGIYEEPVISLSMAGIITGEIRIQGAQGYCWDFPAAINAASRLPVDKLVTHKFPLSELQLALQTALDRSLGSIKVEIEA